MSINNGGEGGIRTHGHFGSIVFKTTAIGHSAISPTVGTYLFFLNGQWYTGWGYMMRAEGWVFYYDFIINYWTDEAILS